MENQYHFKVIFVRHGQNKDNEAKIIGGHRQEPLTEKGKEQAKSVGQQLKKEVFDIFYSSPLKRAKQTAEIINQQLERKQTILFHPLLIERDCGILTGKKEEEIPRLSKEIMSFYDEERQQEKKFFLEAEGAENFPKLKKRAEKFLEEMERKHQGKTILIVGHGDFAKMLRASYLNWCWEKGAATRHLKNTEILHLPLQEDK